MWNANNSFTYIGFSQNDDDRRDEDTDLEEDCGADEINNQYD